MKKFVLIFSITVLFLYANTSTARTDNIKVVTVEKRAGWLDNFRVGSATLKNQHKKQLKKIGEQMVADRSMDVVFKGSYSAERITNGCYVGYTKDDQTVFSLRPIKNLPGSRRVKDEVRCQELLGEARAQNVAEFLASLGIRKSRIHIVDAVDAAIRRGPHSCNRAVSFWLADIPRFYVPYSVVEKDGKAHIYLLCINTYLFKTGINTIRKNNEAIQRRMSNLFTKKP
ncbi:hypothetical protein ACFL2U_01645 [Patescibacteria group bacterium]